nr:hypothetical protein [Tanacetum cinerariifolium]
MKLTKSYLIHMETLSRSKDAEMIRMMTNNPPLDQTGGPSEEELEKNQSLPVNQRKIPQSQLASLQKEEPAPQEFDTGFTEDLHVEEASQLPDWFQKPTKPLILDRD